ncbi:ankyrin repeat-containing domain protein [Triangularia verruculosa]|uniref:Ankyrin repeat-containing domain protein n=1 Tax=Triangularia verruculosa TaxID=2587418 RepID=A0AAN6XSV9_9PEZI|nr:ankyrin repeat-containing domain protein [Triangularia verruculosa]
MGVPIYAAWEVRESSVTPLRPQNDSLRCPKNAPAYYSDDEKPTKDELAGLLQALAHRAPFTELKQQLEQLSYRLDIPVADVLLRSEFIWHEETKFSTDDGKALRTKWTSYGTLLHEAMRENEYDLVKYLVSPFIFDDARKRRLFLEQRDYSGMTALLLAIQIAKDDKLVKYLFQQGADIQAVDVNGWTAMHFAMQNDRLEIIRLLHGRDHGLINKPAASTGDTPVHIMVRKGNEKTIKAVTQMTADLNWFKVNDLGLSPHDLIQSVIGDKELHRYVRSKMERDGWQLNKKKERMAFQKKSVGKQYYQISCGPIKEKPAQPLVDEMDASWD